MVVKKLPGTTIEVSDSNGLSAGALLDSLFLAGGLVLSQVSSLTGLEAHMVQNWVKRGFVSKPVGKKYSKDQFCRIVMINFLKDSLQLDTIVGLMNHINGRRHDEWDDTVGDGELYCYFLDTVLHMAEQDMTNAPVVTRAAEATLEDCKEKYAGSKEKIVRVLHIMIVLYAAGLLKNKAERLIATLQ